MKKNLAGKLPVLLAAGLSLLLPVSLWFFGSKDLGLFVGLWVPSILAYGAFMRGQKWLDKKTRSSFLVCL